ncbi:MAG: DUF4230 domain-containing protein [Fimbriimonadaceae bacterium]|nr:DUF4230 domain-containing protein [Fimbriimonadaceae bacterium]
MAKPSFGQVSAGICLFAAGLLTSVWLIPSQKSTEATWSSQKILTSVRSLGDLHAAEASFQWVITHKTSAEAAPWVSRLPGGQEVISHLTTNEALATATATVSAKVDLKAAEVCKDGDTWVVTLPPASLARPHVSLDVSRESKSLIWKDRNLIPRTTLSAERDARLAAKRLKLEAKAEEEAVALVENLLKTTGSEKFSVRIARNLVENPA